MIEVRSKIVFVGAVLLGAVLLLVGLVQIYRPMPDKPFFLELWFIGIVLTFVFTIATIVLLRRVYKSFYWLRRFRYVFLEIQSEEVDRLKVRLLSENYEEASRIDGLPYPSKLEIQTFLKVENNPEYDNSPTTFLIRTLYSKTQSKLAIESSIYPAWHKKNIVGQILFLNFDTSPKSGLILIDLIKSLELELQLRSRDWFYSNMDKSVVYKG